jgi:hypothetical protein
MILTDFRVIYRFINNYVGFFHTLEPISKRLKSVTPAKADVQKRTENIG